MFKGPGGMKVIVRAADVSQVVPDWIRGTTEYKLGYSDDSIVDLERPKKKPSEKKDAPASVVTQLPAITAAHVEFLQSRGYKPQNIAQAKSFIEKMNEKDQVSFFADFQEHEEEQKAKAARAAGTTPATGPQAVPPVNK